MTEPACPRCGETERLAGSPTPGGIEVVCEACGARWSRGERRCRQCDGADVVSARQRMTTYPRGNQLAVIGMREVALCPSCDRGALARLGPDRVVDDGYRSRYMNGAPRAPTPAQGPVQQARPRPTSSGRRQPSARQVPAAPPQARQQTRAAAPDPTVRRAVDAYLQQASDSVSATAMLVLGRTLGPSTRLADVRATQARAALGSAVDDHWQRQPSLRALAVAAIDDAFRFWARRGWLDDEQVPHLGAADGD